MGRTQRVPLAGTIVAAGVIAASCGSGGESVCVSNDVGRVCADNSDGQIAFTGRGLDPENDVTIENPQVGPIIDVVDADGEPLVGDIVIRS